MRQHQMMSGQLIADISASESLQHSCFWPDSNVKLGTAAFGIVTACLGPSLSERASFIRDLQEIPRPKK